MPVPANCLTCSTAIPFGATRCPACGRDYGDSSQSTQQWLKSVAMGGGAVGLKLAGAGIVGASFIVAGFIGIIGGGMISLIPAGFVGLAGLGMGGLLWSWGSSASRRAAEISTSAQELEVLALAERLGGELYATDVARGLGISVADAEARLAAMADGSRIVADVTGDGLLRFEFRELRLRRSAVETRIAPPDEAAERSQAEAEAEVAPATDAAVRPGTREAD